MTRSCSAVGCSTRDTVLSRERGLSFHQCVWEQPRSLRTPCGARRAVARRGAGRGRTVGRAVDVTRRDVRSVGAWERSWGTVRIEVLSPRSVFTSL